MTDSRAFVFASNWELHPGNVAYARYFDSLSTDPQLALSRRERWPTLIEQLPTIPGQRHLFTDCDNEQSVWVQRDGVSALLSLQGGGFAVTVAGRSPGLIGKFVEEMRGLVPRAEIDDESLRVPVTFWSLSPHGPTQHTRQLDVPSWDDARQNYVGETYLGLYSLMESFTPGAGGQLVVWHGPPGTGKTNALRALAWEWRRWCAIHYITDPETFFGDSASYMLEVLLHEDDYAVDPNPPGASPTPVPPVAERWRLLVLEDTGEMLARDAKDRTGQGLSRLLNVVDGLIGQGLRLLVLVTTNDELKALHPAVARPGRCAANVKFETFSQEQAHAWCEVNNLDYEFMGEGVPLSDLYARLAGRDTSRQREPAKAGFA